MNYPVNTINVLDPRPKNYIRYNDDYSIQAIATSSFGIGYISGVYQTIMLGIYAPASNDSIEPPLSCIDPVDITFEEAKKGIAQYFTDHHGENIDYGDLMDALNIHLSLIVDVCAELESEGKIAGVD